LVSDKYKNLCKLKEKYKELLEKYQPVVMGDGNPDADIFLIGEAPGRHEVEKGRPFVGRAGKNLDEFLKTLELERKDIYITNAVKFRPTQKKTSAGRISNKAPTKKEVELFRPLLMEEIRIFNPFIVVTLGNIPLFSVTEQNIKIGEVHGKPMDVGAGTIFPLYHPASIIYRRELNEVYRMDLEKLKYFLQENKIVV